MITCEIPINDILTLMKVVVCANREFGGQIWWRGNPNYDYQLQPSVFRKKDSGDNYEANIITRFIQKAPALRENLPANDAWFEWLFIMQHYQLPTRLLDWTESPLVACYFAINFDNKEESHADAALFALCPYRLNFFQTGEAVLRALENNLEIAQRAFDNKVPKKDEVLAILPNLIDQRMIAQLSVFTIHDNDEPLECHEKSSEFLVKYKIPASAKKKLKEQLKHAGIRPSSLFPDLEHLSKELKDISKFSSSVDKVKIIDKERLQKNCLLRATPS